jgi:hypothetical protein
LQGRPSGLQEQWRRVSSTRRRKKKERDRVDLTWLHPFFPSSPAVTCNKKKRKRRQLILIHFCPDCSCIFFFLDLLTSVFFLLLSLLFSPSSPGGSSCDWAAAVLDSGCFFGRCLLEAEIWSR